MVVFLISCKQESSHLAKLQNYCRISKLTVQLVATCSNYRLTLSSSHSSDELFNARIGQTNLEAQSVEFKSLPLWICLNASHFDIQNQYLSHSVQSMFSHPSGCFSKATQVTKMKILSLNSLLLFVHSRQKELHSG
ncbi:hypothetical protein CHARACLAT_000776 [Characodon lateralis]|uniref:Uncharacterized protein n=1 Tax=Characodon lateralis TaxID=208331 RepID=A0ABU7DM98_9TELE|nr:hypothetical protein [Characodon lateralis]